MAPWHRHQPQQPVLRMPRGDPAHGQAEARQDYQHRVGLRAARRQAQLHVRVLEGRHDTVNALDGADLRAFQHPDQLHRPRHLSSQSRDDGVLQGRQIYSDRPRRRRQRTRSARRISRLRRVQSRQRRIDRDRRRRLGGRYHADRSVAGNFELETAEVKMASSNASNDFSLEGKSALVVGAEHSVGRAAAVTLAEAGAKIVLASQEPGTDKQIKEVAKLVNAAGVKPLIRVQSASMRADLSATADFTAKQLGALDILVNTLDTPAYGPAEASDDTTFDKVMENNLKTVWMSCQEGARVMLTRGGGVIVNVTSVLAERGVPNAALYCAAKAAVLNLTRT